MNINITNEDMDIINRALTIHMYQIGEDQRKNQHRPDYVEKCKSYQLKINSIIKKLRSLS
jgi:hypothetical protein